MGFSPNWAQCAFARSTASSRAKGVPRSELPVTESLPFPLSRTVGSAAHPASRSPREIKQGAAFLFMSIPDLAHGITPARNQAFSLRISVAPAYRGKCVLFVSPPTRAVTDTLRISPRTIAQRPLPAASLVKPLYWTLIVVSFFASDFDFGRCMVNIPSFDSALIASASIASGSMKLREKLP